MDHAPPQPQWRQYLKELSDLQIKNHRLTAKNIEVGSGGAGLVKLAIMDEHSDSREPQRVAVKALRPHGMRNDRERMAIRLVRELRVWADLKHPNILPLSGYYLDEATYETACLYSPYCERGSLPVFLKSGNFSEACRLQLALDTTKGLDYLHNKHSICHGDIKGDNVLINDSFRAVLCDFGLSRVVDDGKKSGLTTTLVNASQAYASPEFLNDDEGKHTLEGDIWAWGCLLLEIMSGLKPFAKVQTQATITMKIVSGEKPAALEDVSTHAELRSLAAKCWESDPKCRPRITQCAEVLGKALDDQSTLTMTVYLDNPLSPNTFGRVKITGARTGADVWRAVIDKLDVHHPYQPAYYIRRRQQSNPSKPLMGAELLSYCVERANSNESPTFQIKCREGHDDAHDIDRKVFILASLQTTALDDLDGVVDRISAAVAKFETEVTYQWIRFTAREIWYKIMDDSELATSRAMARLCRKLSNELRGNVRFRERGNDMPVTAGPAFKSRIINRCYSYFKGTFPPRSGSDRSQGLHDVKNDRSSSLIQLSDTRAINVVQFIARLYREDTLDWDDMRRYLDTLTDGVLHPDRLRIQCLCTLLTVAGPYMETKQKDAIDGCFAIISNALSAVSNDGTKIDFRSRQALEGLVRSRREQKQGTQVTIPPKHGHLPSRSNTVKQQHARQVPGRPRIATIDPPIERPRAPGPDTTPFKPSPAEASPSREYVEPISPPVIIMPAAPVMLQWPPPVQVWSYSAPGQFEGGSTPFIPPAMDVTYSVHPDPAAYRSYLLPQQQAYALPPSRSTNSLVVIPPTYPTKRSVTPND